VIAFLEKCCKAEYIFESSNLQTRKYKIQAPGNKKPWNISYNHDSIKTILTKVSKYGVSATNYIIRNPTKCY
jgi:hypothetical protein